MLCRFQSKVFQPWRALGQGNVPRLYLCRLRVHPRYLVDLRPEGDRIRYSDRSFITRILNKSCPRAHILNDDHIRVELPRLFNDLLLQLGISELFAQKINEIVVAAADKPGRSNRIVVELAGLRSNIPTLNYQVAWLASRQVVVPTEPLPLDDLAFERNRALLILSREIEAAERASDPVEHRTRLSRLVQDLARRSVVYQIRPDCHFLVDFGNRRQIEMNPRFFLKQVADQILKMQALHDDDDHVASFVVESRIEGSIEPLVDRRARCRRHRIFRLERVVDDYHVTTASGERADHRCRISIPVLSSDEIQFRVLFQADSGERKDSAVPTRLHHRAAIQGVFAGEFLGITRADYATGWVMPQGESRERNGCTNRL